MGQNVAVSGKMIDAETIVQSKENNQDEDDLPGEEEDKEMQVRRLLNIVRQKLWFICLNFDVFF